MKKELLFSESFDYSPSGKLISHIYRDSENKICDAKDCNIDDLSHKNFESYISSHSFDIKTKVLRLDYTDGYREEYHYGGIFGDIIDYRNSNGIIVEYSHITNSTGAKSYSNDMTSIRVYRCIKDSE